MCIRGGMGYNVSNKTFDRVLWAWLMLSGVITLGRLYIGATETFVNLKVKFPRTCVLAHVRRHPIIPRVKRSTAPYIASVLTFKDGLMKNDYLITSGINSALRLTDAAVCVCVCYFSNRLLLGGDEQMRGEEECSRTRQLSFLLGVMGKLQPAV